MKSFGSSLYKAGNTTNRLNKTNTSIKDIIISSFKNALSMGLSGSVSEDAIHGVLANQYNLEFNDETRETLSDISNINIADKEIDRKETTVALFDTSDLISPRGTSLYEDQLKLPSHVLNSINNYKYIFKNTIDLKADIAVIAGTDVSKSQRATNPLYVSVVSVIGSPSLFNPFFSVNANGINPFTPLLNANLSGKKAEALGSSNLKGPQIPKGSATQKYDLLTNIQDCSIQTLVQASQVNKPKSELKSDIDYLSERLGLARYRYADFMFCKDLGKVSNNHLITLRRFTHPVGDNIFTGANNTKRRGATQASDLLVEQEPDLARLVCWFGTGDNQLENIMKYDYSMSWKDLHAEIQEKDSQEDAHQSILGAFVNSTSGGYNKYQAAGFAGGNNIISWLAGRSAGVFNQGFSTDGYQDPTILRNYMKNKVYEPKDTIQDTVLYEGKLKFNQEFSLVFSYKLRQYTNINAKSAFLDLLGNILEVTYRRGIFWQGGRKLVGPPQNTAGWKKAHGYINNAWDQMTSFGEALLRGNIDMGSLFGNASEMVSKAYDSAKNAVGGALSSPKESFNALADAISEFNKKSHFSEALKGQLLNKLGRPYIYAWDAYLNGDDVGLWHVTIGNPFNPIAAFGNLIVTGASIQHSGPLGIDDFPTELKVTVNLKHARSRDITEIGKMYTRGFSNIYSISGYRLKSLYYNSQNENEAKSNTKQMLDNEQARETAETTRNSQASKYNSKIEEINNKYKAKEGEELTEAQKTARQKEIDEATKARDTEIENAREAELNKYGNNLNNEYSDYLKDAGTLPPNNYAGTDVFYAELGTDDFEKMIAMSDEIA